MKSDPLFSIKLEFKEKETDRCCHLSTAFVDKSKTEEDIKVNVDNKEFDIGGDIIEPNIPSNPTIDPNKVLVQTMSQDKMGDIVQKPLIEPNDILNSSSVDNSFDKFTQSMNADSKGNVDQKISNFGQKLQYQSPQVPPQVAF